MEFKESLQASLHTNLKLLEGAINKFSVEHKSVDPRGRPIEQLSGYKWDKLKITKFKSYWYWHRLGSLIEGDNKRIKITPETMFKRAHQISFTIDGSAQKYHYRPLPWKRESEGTTIVPKGTIWLDFSIPIIKINSSENTTIVPKSPKHGLFPRPDIIPSPDVVYMNGIAGRYNDAGVWHPYRSPTMRVTRINLGNNIWTAKPVNIGGGHRQQYYIDFKNMLYDNVNYFVYRSVLPKLLINSKDIDIHIGKNR